MSSAIPKYLTIEEVAKLAKCSVRHIHEEKKRGVLRFTKPGRVLLFAEPDVLKWMNRKSA